MEVSIHAPWEGCDSDFQQSIKELTGFNSRTLGRVRLGLKTKEVVVEEFQFTHPGKGATCFRTLNELFKGVSIHAPWEGCDIAGRAELYVLERFNSRTLGRVRQRRCGRSDTTLSFNSRTLGRVRRAPSVRG